MEKTIIRDLGDGLVLRCAVPDDADQLARFNSIMHMEPGATEPDLSLDLWTRDLMANEHPTFHTEDFLVVEDTRTGQIVSTSNHISQVWSYDGIPFKVGRPELVATHPDYRGRGLVRAQFEVLHSWSAERAEMVQAITGIAYYYRQFGYEMTLSLPGRRIGYKVHITPLKEGEPEPFRVRTATEDDLPFIGMLYDKAMRRYLVSAIRDQAMWRYDMQVRSPGSAPYLAHCIIETPEGEPVGYMAHRDVLSGPTMAVSMYELKPGVRWAAVTPSVLRYTGKRGEEYAAREQKREFGAFMFGLGEKHPVYDIITNQLPKIVPPYYFYVRVPDVPAFLRHIAPVLEKRLEASAFAGHTGELKINFYRSAFRLGFTDGKLTLCDSYMPAHQDDGDMFFPNYTFLHMLFGHLELEELGRVYIDCYSRSDEARALLKALFPRQDSFVLAIS